MTAVGDAVATIGRAAEEFSRMRLPLLAVAAENLGQLVEDGRDPDVALRALDVLVDAAARQTAPPWVAAVRRWEPVRLVVVAQGR